MRKEGSYKIIGHRGVMGLAPENTFASFDLALEMNVDVIECDVRKCRDGFVILHDETLDRTMNHQGLVGNYSTRELSRIMKDEPNPVPFLPDFLESYLRRVELNLELKGDFENDEIESFLRLLEGRSDKVVVSSFNWRLLRKIRSLDSEIKIGILYLEAPELAIKEADLVEALSLHPSLDLLKGPPPFDRNRFTCYPFTVDRKKDHELCLEHAVDGAFYNDPRHGRDSTF